MDINQLTQKSQEALHDAQTKALRFGHTEVDGEHLLLALLDQPDGLVPRLLARPGADPDGCCARTSRPSSSRRPARHRPGRGAGRSASRSGSGRLLDAAEREAGTAQGRVRLGRAPADRPARRGLGTPAGRLLARAGRDPRGVPGGAHRGPRKPAGHLGDAGGRLRGAGEVRPGPRRRRRAPAGSTR